MSRDIISASRSGSLVAIHGGPAIIYRADFGITFPTKIGDVVQLDPAAVDGQFAPKTGWQPLGVTRGGVSVNRSFDEVKTEADQSMGAVDSRPSSWTTTISTELLKTDPATLQLAWVGGAITETAKVTTSLQVAPAAGATSVTVNSASGLSVGDQLSIGNLPLQEIVQIQSIVGNVLTLTQGVQYAHASGSLVLKFVRRSLGFGTARALPPSVLAVLCMPNYNDPGAGGVVNGLRMYAFRYCKLTGGSRTINHAPGSDWTLPVEFQAYPDLDIADPDLDTMMVFEEAYV